MCRNLSLWPSNSKLIHTHTCTCMWWQIWRIIIQKIPNVFIKKKGQTPCLMVPVWWFHHHGHIHPPPFSIARLRTAPPKSMAWRCQYILAFLMQIQILIYKVSQNKDHHMLCFFIHSLVQYWKEYTGDVILKSNLK